MLHVWNFLSRRWLLALGVLLLPVHNIYAVGNNRTVTSYFVDNIIFEIIVSGGYYSLAVLVTLSLLAWAFKKFREVLLSILIAIFAIFLLIFVYQAFEDFNWLN